MHIRAGRFPCTVYITGTTLSYAKSVLGCRSCVLRNPSQTTDETGGMYQLLVAQADRPISSQVMDNCPVPT